MLRLHHKSTARAECCTYIGPLASSSLQGSSKQHDICVGGTNTIYYNMLGGGDALRDNGRVARAAVCLLIMLSLPEMQQLCTVTKTTVCAVHGFRTREYHNHQIFILKNIASTAHVMMFFLKYA